MEPEPGGGLTSTACRAAGACVAAGNYAARNGGIEGVIDTLSGGSWTAARARLPAGAATAAQYVFFNSAACPAAGHCVAVGGYKLRNGGTVGMIDTAASE